MKSQLFCITLCLCTAWIVSCGQTEKPLTPEEKERIEKEVIASIESHHEDIVSQNYEAVMKFYAKDNFNLFGDGTYWGDCNTIDEIWSTWLPRWRKITKWDLKNHKVYVLAQHGAIDFVEWTHERVEEDGDTTTAYGSWAFSMQKFPEGWKTIGAMIDHRYTSGPNANTKE